MLYFSFHFSITYIGFCHFWGKKRRADTILTLITLDYRQTINIIAAHYITNEKYICKRVHVRTQKNIQIVEITPTNPLTHTNISRISSSVMECFIGNDFNDNNISMHLDLLPRLYIYISCIFYNILSNVKNGSF